MKRAFYQNSIGAFLDDHPDIILGQLTRHSPFAVEQTQRDAWLGQIDLLKRTLADLGALSGHVYFEYAIPRMGKRVDVILLIGPIIFVVEFKVGDREYTASALDQVMDYALDLKNFHETSHDRIIAPILISTRAPDVPFTIAAHHDRLLQPIRTNGDNLADLIDHLITTVSGKALAAGESTDNTATRTPAANPASALPPPPIDSTTWETGSYRPTPTIIEAAMALYNGHSVAEISRSDASGAELHRTTDTITRIVADAQANSYKAICFVTGVPGAGKTLIGLNVATQTLSSTPLDDSLVSGFGASRRSVASATSSTPSEPTSNAASTDTPEPTSFPLQPAASAMPLTNESNPSNSHTYSVFLSGNGPLVKVLQEALACDRVEREKLAGRKLKKGVARSEVKTFIQNVHHYRDECLRDPKPPVDHVALFDEAQRAWDLTQTSKFMQQKKGQPDFAMSEPEFLISCIDRHPDWGVVVCLVGGGQEINTGEAGISEWIAALKRSFPDWHIHISNRLTDAEYAAREILDQLADREHVTFDPGLHLSVAMRSFRAENVSLLVKQILDLDPDGARATLAEIGDRFPIVLTRDLDRAKAWLREKARGSERYGIVVSSQANRLKPLAIDVRYQPNPVHWFLADKTDVRSSYYLEDVATEFDVQGLELDWVCVTWDADFRYSGDGWLHRSFRGNKWQRINKESRQTYLKNAYRVLLTRARQGMVIVVPEGDENDPTRDPAFYDETFEYLKGTSLQVVN